MSVTAQFESLLTAWMRDLPRAQRNEAVARRPELCAVFNAVLDAAKTREEERAQREVWRDWLFERGGHALARPPP